MKLNKKKVVVVSLAISLIAILSLGSLAWFNAKDEVTNKFMVTNSEDDADKIFSVDVWEYVDGDTQNKDQDGNEYNDIVPDNIPAHRDISAKHAGHKSSGHRNP